MQNQQKASPEANMHDHHAGHGMNHDMESTPNLPSTTKISDYFPLLLIFLYLIALSAALTNQIPITKPLWINYWFDFMINFEAFFFIIFSLFKLLDLKNFAEGYSSYDLIAGKFNAWGFIYPFVELFFGFALLARYEIKIVAAIIFIIMLISSLGVINSLLKHRKIHCVCLGNILKVPLTNVTLFENILMLVMAGIIACLG